MLQGIQQASYISNKRQVGCLWRSEGKEKEERRERWEGYFGEKEEKGGKNGTQREGQYTKTTDNVMFIPLPRPAINGTHNPSPLAPSLLFIAFYFLSLSISKHLTMVHHQCSVLLLITIPPFDATLLRFHIPISPPTLKP